jgi:ADP-ribose pyrophosphatase YjhB (NUDIX family)
LFECTNGNERIVSIGMNKQIRVHWRSMKVLATHPQRDQDGESVIITSPTNPSLSTTWDDGHAIFAPDSPVPDSINGIAIESWVTHPRTDVEWQKLDSLHGTFDEPKLVPSGKPLASGVVVVEHDGRIWMVSPTNRFGGYPTTFPKGKVDAGLGLQANAVKEVFEESGLMVRITGFLGDFKRTTSMTRLYLGQRVGGNPSDMGWESQAVRLVPRAEWDVSLQNPSDRPVLAALLERFPEEK